MSVIEIIRCDGSGCTEQVEVFSGDTVDSILRHTAWKQDPNCGFSQYCPDCVIKIMTNDDPNFFEI